MALALAFVVVAFLVSGPPARAAATPPGAPVGVVADAGTLSATVRWIATDASVATYTVVSTPGGISATVPGTSTSATVTGLGFGLDYRFTVSGTNSAGTGPASHDSNPVSPLPPGGPFHAVSNPVLLTADLAAGAPVDYGVGDDQLGIDLVPFHGVSGVVLNVTAGQASAPTTVQLLLSQQVVQTIPLVPGQVQSTLAVIGVPGRFTGASVQVTAGQAHVEIDLAGYFSDPTGLHDHAGMFQPLTGANLLNAPLAAGGSTDVQVLGQGGVPSAHVAAVLLNVTASGTTGAGELTVLPAGAAPTGATTLGFGSGQTSANRAIVAVPPAGSITVLDEGAAASARVDVLGWFTDGTDATAVGGLYTSVTPARLVDTSTSGGPLLAGGTLNVPVWGHGGAPSGADVAPPTSAVLEVAAVSPSGTGSLAMGGASIVQFAAGVTVSNVDVVPLASDGSVSISAFGANTNVAVNLMGYFSGDLIVPGTTKALPASLLDGITSLTDTTITFAAGAQVTPPINVNDVINAGISPKTPSGFLRRVLAIDALSTGETVVTTRNASLTEALTSYSVNWTQPRRSGALGMRSAVAGARSISLPPFPPPVGTSIDPSWPVFALAGGGHTVVLPIGASFSKLSGEIDINDLELQLIPHIALGKNPFTNPQFEVGLSVGLRFQADASILGTIAGATWTPFDQETVHVEDSDFIDVGPIVIVETPVTELKVTADLTLQGGITEEMSIDKYGLVTGGYDHGFFANYNGLDYIPNGKMVSLRPTVQAEFRPGLHFIGGVLLYGFAKLAGDENPYLRITVDPFANPWWDVALGICKNVVIGIDISYLFTGLKQEATIDLRCDEFVILSAPGRRINITIAPSPATVPRSGTQHFTATADNSTGHGVLWSIVESNGGSLSNASPTSVDYTAPSRAGTYHVRASAVDDPTSVQDVTITVPAVAPSPPINVAASFAGTTAVTVTWAAPLDDGGAAINDYTVASSDGTVIDAGTSTFATFNGLTPGTSYTFTVYATNSQHLTSVGAASPPITVPTSAVVTIVPASLNFGPNPIGQQTQPQTVTVSVAGGSLTITSVKLGGVRPQDYAILNDLCSGVTLPSGGSCTFQVAFTAAIQDLSSASVLVNDDAVDSPQTVILQGMGPQPVVSGYHGRSSQFVDDQHGWSGNMATTDGGKTWTPMGLINGPSASGTDFIDANHGWIAGQVPTGNGCFAECTGVWATSDGGATWTRLTVIPLLEPTSMSFSDLNHGWISGITFIATDTSGIGSARTEVFATNDGGHTWTKQSLPDPQFSTCTLAVDERVLQVSFTDSNNGWAIGMSACVDHFAQTESNPLTLAWSTNDGGAHWTVHDTGLNTYHWQPGPLRVLSAGQMGVATQDFNGGGAPIILTTTDGGATWAKLPLPGTFAADFGYLDAQHLVLLDAASLVQSVYTSSDGGHTWTKTGDLPASISFTLPGYTNENLFDYLDVLDGTHWWVSGEVDYVNSLGQAKTGGLIYFSGDGGVTWTLQLAGNGS